MKCQILFSGKYNKKNIVHLSSTEFAQRVVKVNYHPVKARKNLQFCFCCYCCCFTLQYMNTRLLEIKLVPCNK